MGLFVTDRKTFANGLKVENFVVSIKGCVQHIIKLKKEKRTKYLNGEPLPDDPTEERWFYRVCYMCYYFISEEAYASGFSECAATSHELDLSAKEIETESIFTHIYRDMKNRYRETRNL